MTAKMQQARRLIRAASPELMVDGEMRPELALDEAIRNRIFPDSDLVGRANLLVIPNVGAASILTAL